MHLALEELEADDGVDDHHEEHQQGDVEERQHGLEDGVEDHLQACGAGRGAGLSFPLALQALPRTPSLQGPRTGAGSRPREG